MLSSASSVSSSASSSASGGGSVQPSEAVDPNSFRARLAGFVAAERLNKSTSSLTSSGPPEVPQRLQRGGGLNNGGNTTTSAPRPLRAPLAEKGNVPPPPSYPPPPPPPQLTSSLLPTLMVTSPDQRASAVLAPPPPPPLGLGRPLANAEAPPPSPIMTRDRARSTPALGGAPDSTDARPPAPLNRWAFPRDRDAASAGGGSAAGSPPIAATRERSTGSLGPALQAPAAAPTTASAPVLPPPAQGQPAPAAGAAMLLLGAVDAFVADVDQRRAMPGGHSLVDYLLDRGLAARDDRVRAALAGTSSSGAAPGASPARGVAGPMRDPRVPLLSAAHRREVLELYEQVHRAANLLRATAHAMRRDIWASPTGAALQSSAAYVEEVLTNVADLSSQVAKRRDERRAHYRRRLAADALAEECGDKGASRPTTPRRTPVTVALDAPTGAAGHAPTPATDSRRGSRTLSSVRYVAPSSPNAGGVVVESRPVPHGDTTRNGTAAQQAARTVEQLERWATEMLSRVVCHRDPQPSYSQRDEVDAEGTSPREREAAAHPLDGSNEGDPTDPFYGFGSTVYSDESDDEVGVLKRRRYQKNAFAELCVRTRYEHPLSVDARRAAEAHYLRRAASDALATTLVPGQLLAESLMGTSPPRARIRTRAEFLRSSPAEQARIPPSLLPHHADASAGHTASMSFADRSDPSALRTLSTLTKLVPESDGFGSRTPRFREEHWFPTQHMGESGGIAF